MNNGGNSGIRGYVNDTVGAGFGVFVLHWKEGNRLSSVDITGMGDADQSDSLSLIESGSLLIRGQVRKDLYPVPTVLKNATGTVTEYYDKAISNSGATDVNRSASYRFTEVNFEDDEKDQTLWRLTLMADRVSAVTTTGFGGTQTITSARTPGNKYAYEGRVKLYDPAGLNDTSDQTIFVWGLAADTDANDVATIGTILAAYTTPPQTSEKQHTITSQRLASGVIKIRIHWSPRSTTDDELFPETISTRGPSEPFTDSEAFILNDTRGTAQVSNVLNNACSNTDYLHTILVRPRTDGKKRVVYKYVNPGVLVNFHVRSGARQIAARLNGTNSQLLLANAYQYSATRALLVLSYLNDYTQEINDFTIFRQVRGTHVPKADPDTINGVTLPAIGTVNSGAFLGYAEGHVAYAGVRGKVNIGLSTGGTVTFVMFMAYAFHANTYGIVTGLPQQIIGRKLVQQIGSATLTAIMGSLSTSAPIWVNAADIGYPGIIAPPSGSFDAFVSWSAP